MFAKSRSWEFPLHIVSSRLYRSPQPTYEDLARLKEGGLRTVVNLRGEGQESYFFCKQLQLNYHYIPVVDWAIPTFEQIDEFIELLAQEERCPALVHCLAGVGRTGVFVSCYRISQGMSALNAMALSDQETPWMGMSENQREFLKEFEARLRG